MTQHGTFIDVTPTWEGIVPILITVLRDGNEEGRKTIEAELRRMAQLADKYVASQKVQS